MKIPEKHNRESGEKKLCPRTGAPVYAAAVFCAAQVFAVLGCAGEIKPPREPQAQAWETDCDEAMDENSGENSEERVKCMERDAEKTEKTCKQLLNEETTAENVHKKIDCLEYRFKTGPPDEGINVFSWH